MASPRPFLLPFKFLRNSLPFSGLPPSLAHPASLRLPLRPITTHASRSSTSSWQHVIPTMATLSSRQIPTRGGFGNIGFFGQMRRASAFSLNNLKPNRGATKKKVRLGRGNSSGKGNTSGKGNKGQRARKGGPKLVFEGGQTPMTIRYPKFGMKKDPLHITTPLNLSRLQLWIDRGLIDPTKQITMRELVHTRCVHSIKKGGIKLLGDGELRTPVNIILPRASSSAISAVENLGGSVVCRYYTPLTTRALINPLGFERKGRRVPRDADPVKRRDIIYYSRWDKRGYLARRPDGTDLIPGSAPVREELLKLEGVPEASTIIATATATTQ